MTTNDYLSTYRGGGAIVRSQTEPKEVVQQDYSTFGQGSVKTNNSNGDEQQVAPSTDTRVRLRAMRGDEQQREVYGEDTPDNILRILYETDGLLFPYTPTIGFSQDVSYKNVGLVHTIGDIETYTRTPSVGLNVSATFTVQNQREGQYALAALHFLRTVSKMYFGETDKAAGKAGLPPPVLIFTGYGNYMFDNLPVILKTHSYTLDKSMNMVTINTAQGTARLPSMFEVSMQLQVQQTPKAMRKDFSLDAFRTGALMSAGKDTGWI